ncbi:B12-binding domain-containing radical SAM protein [Endothiovibrio diazotrophicus]
MSKRRLRLLLVKPSHYDDDGYVIQWWRNLVPAQTLAVLNGILHDAAVRGQPADGVSIECRPVDETAMVINTRRELRWLRRAERAAVLLVGVQTNQYPRAVDIAHPFVEAGIPAIMGGFHVSGVLAMTPDWTEGLRDARELGITLFAGELEEGIDELLRDLWKGRLKPLYNHLDRLVDLERAPPPLIDPTTTGKTLRRMAGIDLGRGCPYLCSFCTIINVQGRRPRQRTARIAAEYVRRCAAQGVRDFIVSDDNFARNRNWEAILDELIQLREVEGIPLDLFIQVDVRAAGIPRFVDKAIRAGCRRVFIGVESVRDDNLVEMRKKQNKRAELQQMVLTWKRAGAIVYAGYIIGLPNDTPERVAEDVRFLMEEVAIDVPELYILTPLPGSEDHQRLLAQGVAMDADLNRYDTEHAVIDHPHMSRAEWEALYWQVWEWYFTPEHIERLLKRALASNLSVKDVFKSLLGFYAAIHYDRVHPLQSGMVRRKVRTSRRPGLAVEPAWRYHPRRWLEILRLQKELIAYSWRMYRLYWRVKKAYARDGYREAMLELGEER